MKQCEALLLLVLVAPAMVSARSLLEVRAPPALAQRRALANERGWPNGHNPTEYPVAAALAGTVGRRPRPLVAGSCAPAT